MKRLGQCKALAVAFVAIAVLAAACGTKSSDASPVPTEQARPTETQVPLATKTDTPIPALTLTTTTAPSATAAASVTPTSQPTADVSECQLEGTFVSDVTIPDGSPIEAGSEFTKTWEIHNTGTCTWTVGCRLTYVSGDMMDAPDSVSVPDTAPRGTALVSVPMVAPVDPGKYRSHWRLCIGSDQCFGPKLFVEIVSVAAGTAITTTETPTATQ